VRDRRAGEGEGWSASAFRTFVLGLLMSCALLPCLGLPCGGPITCMLGRCWALQGWQAQKPLVSAPWANACMSASGCWWANERVLVGPPLLCLHREMRSHSSPSPMQARQWVAHTRMHVCVPLGMDACALADA